MTQAPFKVKVAPNSKDSEMMVLGCMLTSINALNIGSDQLDGQDFYYNEHRLVFETLKDAYINDKPADVHLISEELKRRDKLESVGGVGYVTALAQFASTSAYIEEYVEIVKNKSTLRKMINSAQLIEKNAFQEPKDVGETLDAAQQLFFKIGQSALPDQGSLLSDLLKGLKSETKLPFLTELEKRQQQYQEEGPDAIQKNLGVPTHFHDLDKILYGLGNSNLVILASRPAMGKTALMLNIAENICFKNKVPVGIFSLEMSADQLVNRIICSQSDVESEKIKTGSLNGMEYQRIVAAVNGMQNHPMIIDDQAGLRITDIRTRARRMKESHNIQALVIDYLQLISGSGNTRALENRQNEISEISRMLKNLARELNIPVLCGAQLSRRVEERQGHRPMMSDLRESGSIEQEADVVLFLLRRDYYDPNDKPGQAEIIVGKNRHGKVGNVLLTFRKEVGQFANFSYTEDQIPHKVDTQSMNKNFVAFAPEN